MRDFHVPPIVLIGCIGPAVLCLLIIGLVTISWNLPLWVHGPEMKAALERYEIIRLAIFQGKEPASKLEEIATDIHLRQLRDDMKSKFNSSLFQNPDPIVITGIREYTESCSVVILDHYQNYSDVAFVLNKIDDVWKVRFMTADYNAGLAGILNLSEC